MTDQNNLPSEDELNKSHGADHQPENNSSEQTQEEKQSPSRGTKKTTVDEELKSRFGGTAKVLKEASNTKRTSLAIGIGGVVVMLILLMSHHHREEKKEDAVRQQKILEASQAIKSRLDALKEDPEKTPKAPTPFVKHEQAIQATVSKEMIARMNAPTVIYEGGSHLGTANSATNSNIANGGVQEATFMGKGADQAFGNTPYETSTVDAAQVLHPDYTIVSGEMIHATLNVAMNSDLPGMVTATVTSPAYSYTGENELVPRGSRLIGQYSSAVLQGQSRIFIMWNRLVLPNGTSVNINSPDTDQIGQAGEPADYINRHFWSRFGESVLMSILSAGVSNIDVDSSDEYNSAQAYRIAVAESLQESAAGTLKQTLMQKPTLVRYQGAKINVFIAHDLSFYNLYKAQGKAV